MIRIDPRKSFMSHDQVRSMLIEKSDGYGVAANPSESLVNGWWLIMNGILPPGIEDGLRAHVKRNPFSPLKELTEQEKPPMMKKIRPLVDEFYWLRLNGGRLIIGKWNGAGWWIAGNDLKAAENESEIEIVSHIARPD